MTHTDPRIVDQHVITVRQDAQQLRKDVDTLARTRMWYIDPEKL